MSFPDLPLARERTDDLLRLAPPTEGELIEPGAIFGNERPLELEIGTGKGRFLLMAASTLPERNFLGIEYMKPFAEKTIDRLGKRGLTNARVLHADAAVIVARHLPDACLSACHVYFPDPWPKKRHHKRRLFRDEFLVALTRVLAPGAHLRVATDHPGYAEWIRELVPRHPQLVSEDPASEAARLPGMEAFGGEGLTNFEIKYRQQGRPIHRFLWRRV